MRFTPLAVALILLISCHPQAEKTNTEKVTTKKKENSQAPNIIFMVGDGMGHGQLSTLLLDESSEPNILRFEVTGLSRTSSASDKITDSAAGATAFSCGKKTTNGFIGVDRKNGRLNNIAEILSKMGYNTGLVSTSSMTHATPAAYYAHINDRDKEHEIANQMAKSPIDFFAGGGRDFFFRNKVNPDILDDLEEAKFALDTTSIKNPLDPVKKQGYLLARNGLPKAHEGRGNLLSDMSLKAINYLAKKSEPYFLMIEGSQIDWAGHANDPVYMEAEMKDFDRTIGTVLEAIANDKNTLVVVTADHETGGYTLAGKESKSTDGDMERDYDDIDPRFSTGGHSATVVPVLATGPKSEVFTGIYQNTAIYKKLLAIAKGK